VNSKDDQPIVTWHTRQEKHKSRSHEGKEVTWQETWLLF